MFNKFWSLACRYQAVYVVFLTIVLVLLVLSGLTYPFLEPGSASQTITQVNFLLLGFLAAVVGFLYWRCRESQEQVLTEE